jgi:plastocyanin
MKRSSIFSLIVILSFLFTGLAMPTAASANSAQTYTVLVGAENVSRASGVMAYFPDTLHIHVGDTVLWQQNTHEIHTVTFLAGTTAPILIVPVPPPPPTLPGPLMLNPLAVNPIPPQGGPYDGSTYANSGIMSTDPGFPTQFSLTFTKAGSFTYECLVHGMMMSGTLVVEDPSVNIPSPADVSAQAQKTINQQLAHANGLLGQAMSQVPPPQHNPDGTTNYTVLIGWSQGQYDLMDFFPGKLVVHPGDTVNFMLSSTNDAPHTVTFLNGAADIPFITPIEPPFPPILLINPFVLMPINPGQPLTGNGIYSSGLLAPGSPATSYTLTIGDVSGDIPYQCLLHDTSGMEGLLKVVP